MYVLLYGSVGVLGEEKRRRGIRGRRERRRKKKICLPDIFTYLPPPFPLLPPMYSITENKTAKKTNAEFQHLYLSPSLLK